MHSTLLMWNSKTLTESSVIYIILAFITALLLALFQYVYKSKLNNRLKTILTVLRTVAVFGILLLLINPKFETKTYYDDKPSLIVAVDNSESVRYLQQDKNATSILKSITDNPEIEKQFNIKTYSFGKTLKPIDSLSFSEQQSNISNALKQIGEVYSNQVAPIILLSDGNQTYGAD